MPNATVSDTSQERLEPCVTHTFDVGDRSTTALELGMPLPVMVICADCVEGDTKCGRRREDALGTLIGTTSRSSAVPEAGVWTGAGRTGRTPGTPPPPPPHAASNETTAKSGKAKRGVERA